MNTSATLEKQLLTDIDRLREEFQQTQDLYREVCVLLFFRYGMTPTANKLYQLVRKGSMTAPAEALSKFWEDLREKSRVRIEHPDLPEVLKVAAGQLAATLWENAQALANESLESYRDEAKASAIEAREAVANAESERDASRRVTMSTQVELTQAREKIDQLNQQLSATEATKMALQSQLNQAQQENTAQLQRLDETRHDFTSELEKLRNANKLSEESFRASEVRVLMELDRERTTVTKLQKELDAARVFNQQSSDRHHAELTASQVQLGDQKQKLGLLAGELSATRTNRDAIAAELSTAQLNLTNFVSETATLRGEIENLRHQNQYLQMQNSKLATAKKSTKGNSKEVAGK